MDTYILRYSYEYIRSFWCYSYVEHNQDLMILLNDCLFCHEPLQFLVYQDVLNTSSPRRMFAG